MVSCRYQADGPPSVSAARHQDEHELHIGPFQFQSTQPGIRRTPKFGTRGVKRFGKPKIPADGCGNHIDCPQCLMARLSPKTSSWSMETQSSGRGPEGQFWELPQWMSVIISCRFWVAHWCSSNWCPLLLTSWGRVTGWSLLWLIQYMIYSYLEQLRNAPQPQWISRTFN